MSVIVILRQLTDIGEVRTNESIRSYNIPENLVLKELLGLLYSTLHKDLYIKDFEKAPWFAEWQQLKGNVAHAYKKNIYLQRTACGSCTRFR